MRDVHIDDIADRVADKFFLPKRLVRKLTRHMFKSIFRVMESEKHRVLMRGSAMPQVYTDYDVQKLCGEMIEGRRVTYDRFFKKGHKIRRLHKKYINNPAFHLLE